MKARWPAVSACAARAVLALERTCGSPRPPRTTPTTPTNLTASRPPDDFCGTNMLQWDASSDDVDAPSAIEYEIYLHGALFTVGPPGVTFAAPYTFAGTNTWTVVAVDRAGNSSGMSDAATLTVRLDQDLC